MIPEKNIDKAIILIRIVSIEFPPYYFYKRTKCKKIISCIPIDTLKNICFNNFILSFRKKSVQSNNDDSLIKKISINLPKEIVDEIDLIRKQSMSSRSSWFLTSAKNELKRIREEKTNSLLEKLKKEN